MLISYNTYNQNIHFLSSSSSDLLVKEPGLLDSFILKQNFSSEIPGELKFIYGLLLGTQDKGYYQIVYLGEQYTLYKRYKSSLEVVSTNYIQSELRQFELTAEYYYTASKGKLKKLKLSANGVKKEFNSIKDISAIVDEANSAANPESVLISIFDVLNK